MRPAGRPFPNSSTEEFRQRVGKHTQPRYKANKQAKSRAVRGKNPFQNMAKSLAK